MGTTGSTKFGGFATRAIHHGYDPVSEGGALTPPLHLTSTFAFESADLRIDGDTTVEDRPAVDVANLADQLHIDLNGVFGVFVPTMARPVEGVDETYRPGLAQIDGNHLADRPQACRFALRVAGECGDGGACAVAIDHTSEQTFQWLRLRAPLLTGGLGVYRTPFNIHTRLPPFPREECSHKRVNCRCRGLV